MGMPMKGFYLTTLKERILDLSQILFSFCKLFCMAWF